MQLTHLPLSLISLVRWLVVVHAWNDPGEQFIHYSVLTRVRPWCRPLRCPSLRPCSILHSGVLSGRRSKPDKSPWSRLPPIIMVCFYRGLTIWEQGARTQPAPWLRGTPSLGLRAPTPSLTFHPFETVLYMAMIDEAPPTRLSPSHRIN